MNERAQHQPAGDDLDQPEPEDIGAKPPQPRRVKLQPDQEQQQGNADLRHLHHRFRLVDQAQRERADDHPGDDIAEGRTEPEPAEQRDEQQRRAEHQATSISAVPVAAAVASLSVTGCRSRRAARGTEQDAAWRGLRDRAGANAATLGQSGSSALPSSQAVSPASPRSTSSRPRPFACAATNAADACPNAQA